MTTYAEVQGSTLIKYPYTSDSLQAENQTTNYGSNIANFVSIFPGTDVAIANGYTLAPVTIEAEPSFDVSTQSCVQNAPTLVDGVWTASWTIAALDPTIIAQNLLVWNQRALTNKRATGITVSGVPIPADPTTSGELAGLRFVAQDNANTAGWTFNLPLSNGTYVTLTPALIIGAGQAVGGFIKAVMDVAAANTVAINATPPTITTTAQIDGAYAALQTSF